VVFAHLLPTFAGTAVRNFASSAAVALCTGYVGCRLLTQKYSLSAYVHPLAGFVIDGGVLLSSSSVSLHNNKIAEIYLA
jgi:hypothetical protein